MMIFQVISETLRFNNPVGILQRCVTKDYTIPGTDLLLKKDDQIWLNVVSVHFDSKHYENPYQFDPEHFSKEAKTARSP